MSLSEKKIPETQRGDSISLRATLWTTAPVYLAMGILMTGNGLLGALVGYRAVLSGFSEVMTGLLMAGHFFGIILGAVTLPRLLSLLGPSRSFTLFCLLAVLSIFLLGTFINPIVWILLRIVTGVSIAGLCLVAESWINGNTTNKFRGRVVSVYVIFMMLGMTVGPLLIGLENHGAFFPFAVAAGFFAFAMLLPMRISEQKVAIIQYVKMPIRTFWHRSPFAVVAIVLIGFTQGSVFGYAIIAAVLLEVPIVQASIFLATLTAGAMVGQYPAGYFSDRYDRRVVLMVFSCVSLAAAIYAVFFDMSFYALLLFAVMFGLGGLSTYSIAVAHGNDRLEKGEIISVVGIMLALNSLGAVLGPIVMSLTIMVGGPKAYFGTLALAQGILILYALNRIVQRKMPPNKRCALPPCSIVPSLPPLDMDHSNKNFT